MKYNGQLEGLELIIASEFLIEETKELKNGFQIRTDEGGVINWYPNTGTLLFQGKKEAKDQILSYLNSKINKKE